MTATTYVATIVSAVLAPLFSSDDSDDYLGADAVEAAINETADIADRVFEATLGEPQLKDFGGFFRQDWKVVIPTEASDYEDPGSLVFDLPFGHEDDSSMLYVLMDVTGADSIGDIEGTEVPMEIVGGNPMVLWDAVRDADGAVGVPEPAEVEDVGGNGQSLGESDASSADAPGDTSDETADGGE